MPVPVDYDYEIIYLNQNGSWTYSIFKSDWYALGFREYPWGMVPCEFYE